MFRLPSSRPPVTPGEILLHDYIEPMGLTQSSVAESIGVPFQRLNGVVRGRRALTPSTALRLAKFFGTSAGFWVNLQARVDTWNALQAERDEIERIVPAIAA